MKTITLHYKTDSEITPIALEKLCNGCNSNRYNIQIVFHDFSLSKTNREILEKNNNNKIKIIEHDFEDFASANKIIFKSINDDNESLAIIIINKFTVLNENALDDIDIERIFSNDKCSLIYGDYTNLIDGKELYIYLKSPVMISIPIALVIISTRHIKDIYDKYKDNDEHILKLDEIMFQNFASIHVPRPLGTTHTYV